MLRCLWSESLKNSTGVIFVSSACTDTTKLNVTQDADSPKAKETLVQMRELTFCFNRWEYQEEELQSLCSMLPSTFQHILNIN